MAIKPHDALRVNPLLARLLRALLYIICSIIITWLAAFCAFPTYNRSKRYMVPGIPLDQKQRTAAYGFPDIGLLRSVRTSDGRRYSDDEIAVLICILDEAEADGLDDLEVVVNYRKTQTEITYSTTIAYLREHGRRVLGVSGWELSMPRCMWSIDGAAPAGLSKPKAPEAEQPMLFDMPVERKVVYR